MPFANLISEFWTYAHTQEYREGLFVEASGLILDVFLIIVGAKVITYFLAIQSKRATSFASSFFIVQFLRDVLLLQLRSGGVGDINTSLEVAIEKREIDSLFFHFLYGNTNNLIDLLKLRMKSGEHIAGHRSLTAKQRIELSKDAKALLERLDSLLVILASLRQEDQCLRAYDFRLVLTATSDYLGDLSDSNRSPPPRTYAPISTALAVTVANWFQSCKKTLDRRYKKQIRWAYVSLLLSLPWFASYRYVVRRWQRLRGRPYTDPFSSNFPQLFCNALASKLGSEWREVVAAADIDKDDFYLLTSQHRALSHDKTIALLEKLRQHVPASVWNSILTASLTADVDSIPTSVVTVDAVKADALNYLARLSVKDDRGDHVIEEALQNLWSLRPSVR